MRFVTIFCFLFLIISANAQVQNEKGTLKLQGSAVYGFDAGFRIDEGALGFNIGLESFISNQFSLNISYTDYLNQEAEERKVRSGDIFTKRLKVVNLDGRYYFMSGKIKPYLLLGFAHITNNYEIKTFSTPEMESETSLGCNGGAGVSIELNNNLSILYQTKYQITEIDRVAGKIPGQVVIHLGLSYKIR